MSSRIFQEGISRIVVPQKETRALSEKVPCSPTPPPKSNMANFFTLKDLKYSEIYAKKNLHFLNIFIQQKFLLKLLELLFGNFFLIFLLRITLTSVHSIKLLKIFFHHQITNKKTILQEQRALHLIFRIQSK